MGKCAGSPKVSIELRSLCCQSVLHHRTIFSTENKQPTVWVLPSNSTVRLQYLKHVAVKWLCDHPYMTQSSIVQLICGSNPACTFSAFLSTWILNMPDTSLSNIAVISDQGGVWTHAIMPLPLVLCTELFTQRHRCHCFTSYFDLKSSLSLLSHETVIDFGLTGWIWTMVTSSVSSTTGPSSDWNYQPIRKWKKIKKVIASIK